MKTKVVAFDSRSLNDLTRKINDYANTFKYAVLQTSLTENYGTFYVLVVFQHQEGE